MAGFTLSTTCKQPYDATVALVRDELAEAGFGIITEIDLAATFATKLEVTTPPQLILGACNPRFAYTATQAEPSVAALLPCNVVVRSVDADTTVVEAFDPAAMARLSEDGAEERLAAMMTEVRRALLTALARVEERSMRTNEED